ncbi:hypothetical protein [Maribacter sp. R77961]|uniref:hypothetical protein n=1 Tax=Maribacter sp. R77961 TaxID=3093871 RepID=UPI0037CB4F7E
MLKKYVCCLLTLMVFNACSKSQNRAEVKTLKANLEQFEAQRLIEKKTRDFAEGYIKATNSPNWKTEMRSYLKGGPESDKFLEEEYTVFRKSFPNAQITIKHIMVNGNKCILWLEETANYVETYLADNDFRDNILKGTKAKNQFLKWNEVWYFNVEDDKFGSEWDFLKDNHKVLNDLKLNK